MIYRYVLAFWLILQLFNLIGLPAAFTLLKNLPDRGYAFARPLGLLLVGFTLWLAGSFGLLRNNPGGALLALAVAGGAGWVWRRRQGGPALREWLRANLSYALTVEAIFAAALVGWAVFKAYNPNIETSGGEKWMETAFVNASLLSPGFPPQDPWLSGFGISYYYFGYVLMAILTRLSGITPTTAFNLFIPTLFALTLTGAFGLSVNLAAAYRRRSVAGGDIRRAGLLGPLFVALLGPWEGALEVIHSRGLLSPAFWRWLDIRDLKIPPPGPGPWIPDRFIWWWRGSRVILDYALTGQEQEMIDEFPFFSFMLGDVHPHVLALPFVLLAIALALNLLLAGGGNMEAGQQGVVRRGLAGLVAATGGRVQFLLAAVCIGSLGFLNTWDFPIYLALFGLAYLAGRGRARLAEALAGLAIFAATGAALYLPFYLSFQSQAGGILPNLWNPTRLNQFTVFFGPFLIIGAAFLLAVSKNAPRLWRRELRWTLPLTLAGPAAILLALALSFVLLPTGRELVRQVLNDPAVQSALNGAGMGDLLREIIARRLSHPWTFLLLGTLAGWGLAHLWAATPESDRPAATSTGPAEKFGLILLLLGLALPLAAEVVYLRDLFGYRMNTVFKFYFQAWILLALASAFGVYFVAQRLAGLKRTLWAGGVAALILAGLVYPVLALPSKANNFRAEPTLDGIAWVAREHPGDYAAILWLRNNAPPGAVVLERPGKSYNYLSRVSALSGRATLLGWDFHEYQWRGNTDEANRRRPDIDRIYNGLDPVETLTLLDKYVITYVYVGPLEREVYAPKGLAKFDDILDVAFSQGDVTIYRR